ncbi:thiamine pyrophosphokinase [Clostridium sp. CAG:448]|mgnify:FL=1|nr:thiamine pyrophosphokinase [Clostridium sp. CAG:448]
MRAFIYAGGSILADNITEHPKGDDLCIAADAGYRNAQELGERVNILIGDFDSLGTIPEGDMEVLQVPAEKDLTDTQIAVETALARGADEIILIGGLGSRMDHSLSTLAILEDLRERHVHAHINNGYNRVHYLNASSTLILRSGFRYLSVLAIDEKIKGLSIDGCKYPLKRATLNRRLQYAISNEITGNCAMISLRRGRIFVIESRD